MHWSSTGPVLWRVATFRLFTDRMWRLIAPSHSKNPDSALDPHASTHDDALQRLMARGLFAACKTTFSNRFQGENARALH